ncbi:DNA-binding transcriptional MerR regulator [Sinorhizobium fredii]|uniref:MerR family transcriptional regulator n=1 Tax=Rhizobium fredii TaxID=380 RepID=UPI0035142267
MPETWRMRAFSSEEASQISGVHRGTLDVWIHREPADLFSQKRGTRRYFSPQDISIIAVALDLSRGGMPVLTSIACAFERLQSEPPADAILVVKNGAVSPRTGRVIADKDVPQLQVDHSFQLIPIGQIAARVRKACAELYEGGADVAV